MTEVKIPIAKDKSTGELVHIDEAINGKKCGCICFCCESDLIAYNKGEFKQNYFGHMPNNTCSAKYETFIHWITKEIIKRLKTMKLPQIYASNLEGSIDIAEEVFNEKMKTLYDYNDISKFNNEFVIQDETEILITNSEIEKVIEITEGKIRVDAIVRHKDTEFIIEPFFSNPVSEQKTNLIMHIDKSALSIDLKRFFEKHTHFFKIEILQNYIQNETEGKEWINLSRKKVQRLLNKYKTNLNKVISNFDIENLQKLKNEIDKNKIEILTLEKESKKLYYAYQNAYNELSNTQKNLKSIQIEFNKQLHAYNNKKNVKLAITAASQNLGI